MALLLLLIGLSQRSQVLHVVAVVSVAHATQHPTSYRSPNGSDFVNEGAFYMSALGHACQPGCYQTLHSIG